VIVSFVSHLTDEANRILITVLATLTLYVTWTLLSSNICKLTSGLYRLTEVECIAITFERKYYELQRTEANTFVKRSLSPGEWACNIAGELFVPRMGMERLRNEAAASLNTKRAGVISSG
jgi:hypothetical protein